MTAWMFRLPGAVAHVPADNVQEAMAKLRRTCHRDAPVDAWPVLGTYFVSVWPPPALRT